MSKYKDGWTRVYRGYPNMSQPVKDMLYKFTKKKQYGKLVIFFVGKMGYDEDYAQFLIRELVRGYV